MKLLADQVLIEVDITMELKEYVTIRDPNGNKLVQEVEYEWKPSYYKQCNKVALDCGNQVKKKEMR